MGELVNGFLKDDDALRRKKNVGEELRILGVSKRVRKIVFRYMSIFDSRRIMKNLLNIMMGG